MDDIIITTRKKVEKKTPLSSFASPASDIIFSPKTSKSKLPIKNELAFNSAFPKTRTRKYNPLLLVFLSLLVIAGVFCGYFFLHLPKKGVIRDATFVNAGVVTAIQTNLSVKDGSTFTFKDAREYKDDVFRFTFKYPKELLMGSSNGSVAGDASKIQRVIYLGKKDNAALVQILITPFAEKDLNITSERIKKDLPHMKIENAEVIEIGANKKGLAFMSDNKVFGGKSREVWLVYNGNLYQMSTYVELDSVLQQLLGTWKFE